MSEPIKVNKKTEQAAPVLQTRKPVNEEESQQKNDKDNFYWLNQHVTRESIKKAQSQRVLKYITIIILSLIAFLVLVSLDLDLKETSRSVKRVIRIAPFAVIYFGANAVFPESKKCRTDLHKRAKNYFNLNNNAS